MICHRARNTLRHPIRLKKHSTTHRLHRRPLCTANSRSTESQTTPPPIPPNVPPKRVGKGIHVPIPTSSPGSESLYDGHIPTSHFQKALLALGSGIVGLCNPLRADMIATLGETTGTEALIALRDRMLSDPTGRLILSEKPRVTPQTVNVEQILATHPPNTLGYAYAQFMFSHGFRSDERFVDDPELAYVITRYREVHDFWHVLSGFETTVEAEIALKWFEFLQTGLPMTFLSGAVGPLRLTPSQWITLATKYIPWAVECNNRCKFLLNVYYEKMLDVPLDEVRRELNFIPI